MMYDYLLSLCYELFSRIAFWKGLYREKLELKFHKRVISVFVTKTKEGPSQADRQPKGNIHIIVVMSKCLCACVCEEEKVDAVPNGAYLISKEKMAMLCTWSHLFMWYLCALAGAGVWRQDERDLTFRSHSLPRQTEISTPPPRLWLRAELLQGEEAAALWPVGCFCGVGLPGWIQQRSHSA